MVFIFKAAKDRAPGVFDKTRDKFVQVYGQVADATKESAHKTKEDFQKIPKNPITATNMVIGTFKSDTASDLAKVEQLLRHASNRANGIGQGMLTTALEGSKDGPEPSADDVDKSLDQLRLEALENMEACWRPELTAKALQTLADFKKTLESALADYEFLSILGQDIFAAINTASIHLREGRSDFEKRYNEVHGRLVDGWWPNLRTRDADSKEHVVDRKRHARIFAEQGSKEGALRAYCLWHENMLGDLNRFNEALDAAREKAVESVRTGATKAYIEMHPTNKMKAAKITLKVADQGIKATSVAGGVVGGVPEGHCKAAGMAINITASCLTVLKACADRAIMAAVTSYEVGQFKESYGKNAILNKLTEEPTTIAETLAKKNCDTVELLMTLALPLVTLADQFMPKPPPPFSIPGLAEIWDQVTDCAVHAVEEYENGRIADAVATLKAQGAVQINNAIQAKADPAQNTRFWAAVSAPLQYECRSVLTNCLTIGAGWACIKEWSKPLGEIGAAADKLGTIADKAPDVITGGFAVLALDFIRATLIFPLIDKIVAKLPRTPAQLVTGEDLKELMGSITSRIQSRGIRIQQRDTFKPTHDNRGIPVQCILSGAKSAADTGISDLAGLKYFLVRLDYDSAAAKQLPRESRMQPVGRLYVLANDDKWDLMFEPKPMPTHGQTDEFTEVADHPRRTSSGNLIREISPAGKVRVDEFWGTLSEDGVFTAETVDEGALADWGGRVVRPLLEDGKRDALVGYVDDSGQKHEGTWRESVFSGNNQIYVFIPTIGGWAQREWASKFQKVGNSGKRSIADVLVGGDVVMPQGPGSTDRLPK